MAPPPPMSAIERPNVITSFSAEDDLDKVWAEIIVRCNKVTKWDLNDKKPITIDQVLAKINPPKDGKPGVQDKAKTVFKSTLICVQRFGSIAAQAASAVFGPSQQCFNAISFVVTAIQDYDAVFSNITALMERVSVFLEKLRIYLDDTHAETKLDKRLRLTVYRVLEHFLMIMGLAHRLTHGWKGKLKLAAKIGAFGEDDGVKDAMAKLETRISDVTNTEITVIVKDLSEAAKNIRGVDKKLDLIADAQEKTIASLGHLETAEQRRTADEEEKKRLNEIREALNIDSTKRPWIERQDEFWGKHIEGTGNWLLKFRYPSFARWSDPKVPDANVMSVKADEGFGKSYLCSIVVNHLQEKHREDPRVGVAYYYFQRDVQDKSPINKAMKAIIYQLASASTAVGREYARLVQKSCDRKTDFGRTADLWKRLITDVSRNLEATFFIVLDGFDEAEVESGKPLANIISQILSSEGGTQLKIRLFMTGRPSGLDSLSDDVDSAIPEIRIAPPQGEQSSLNEEDILLYAEERLNDMDIFGDDDEEVSDLKERAKTELGQGVQGDYFALDYKLDSISKSRNFREVEDILSLAKESRTQAIAREIDQLNETLGEDEVREVNKLLIWETVCFSDLSVDQYAAILLLEADTRSLISLEKQVRDRYSSLFDISESKLLTLRSDDIRDYLREKDEMAGSRDNGIRRIDAALQEGEVALVKRVLKTHFNNIFGAEDVYERFAFDEFFASKLGNQATRIRLLTNNENHARVAQACLIANCDHFEEKSYSDLHPYSWEWFADHLSRVEIEDVDAPTRQDIGRKLVRVLRETELIDVWWNEDRIGLRQYWVFKTFCTDAVHDWLKDSVVQKGLSDMPSERQWVMSTTASDGPSVKILENVAKRLAEHWLAQKQGMWFGAFSFLHGYLSQLRGEDPDWSEDPNVEQTNLVVEWAKKTLPNTEESKWHHCLAETFYITDYYQESVSRFKSALEAAPDDWKLSLGLAQSLGRAKETKEAVDTLEKLIEAKHELITTDDEFREEYWESMLHLIGDWNIQLKDFAAAELTYRKLLDEGMTKETFHLFAKKAVSQLTQALNEQSKYKETVDLLVSLEARTDEDAGSWLSGLLHYYAEVDELHDRAALAAHSVHEMDTLLEKYQVAIEKARLEASKFGIYIHLKYWLGALMRTCDSKEQREAALDVWEDVMNMDLPADNEDDVMVNWARRPTARNLAVAFLDAAKEAGLSMPLNPPAEAYAVRLEKLTHGDPDYVRAGHHDARIPLARLHHLAGDDARARDISREILKIGFQKFEDDDYKAGLYSIATVLQAMDDDANATAAWCLFTPWVYNESDHEDGSEGGSGRGSSSGEEETDKSDEWEDEDEDADLGADAVSEAEEKDATRGKENGEEEQAEAGAERPKEDSEAPETITNAENTEEQDGQRIGIEQKDAVEKDSIAEDGAEDDDALEGLLHSYCDGHCDTNWSYIDNIYSCKDCLDVQLEPNCYAKLQNEELDPKVCSRKHSHLHLPAFDRKKWEDTPKDQMWVDGKLMDKKAWAEGIKKEWGIDERSLQARERLIKAITKIQKAWRWYKPAVQPLS